MTWMVSASARPHRALAPGLARLPLPAEIVREALQAFDGIGARELDQALTFAAARAR